MKWNAVILLQLCYSASFAQQQTSFSLIDERVKSVAVASPSVLAYALTKEYASDKDKVRAIFSWITENISYRVKKSYTNTKLAAYTGRIIIDDTGAWKSANDYVAETVLQSRSAVCDGYARLFKSLCNYAGLRAEIVTGFAKGDLNRQPVFRSNHTWNAVYIDSAWQLLDVTWASGYTSYRGDEFIKHFDETYFLPAPEVFIRDHFPDDVRWTLMEAPPLPGEFSISPYKNKSFGKYSISSFAPANGIIEAAVGDTIKIMLSLANAQADKKMAADTITSFDSVLQKITPAIAVLEPVVADNQNRVHYYFCVQQTGIQWLHIVYNHDTILRYRLKITGEKEGLAIQATPPARRYP